jgi:hypothetical protein
MSIIEKLTEGVVRRDVQKEGAAILDKWEKTGLLEGIGSDHTRNSMACLLENQAKELLREASTMAGGDVEGFAAVAFPIVRRVFGGLIANELVSVQPMSLPSGLIFFLDFTFNSTRGAASVAGASLYGGGAVGAQITGGVNLSNVNSENSFYSLNNGYSSPITESVAIVTTVVASGTVGAGVESIDKAVKYDPDLSGSKVCIATIPLATFTAAQFNTDNFITIDIDESLVVGGGRQVRRHTGLSGSSTTLVQVVLEATGSETTDYLSSSMDALDKADFMITDDFTSAGLGAVVGTTAWELGKQHSNSRN